MGRRWLQYGIPVLMIAVALLLRVSVPAVEEVQLKVFDGYQRLSPRVYEPVPVRYVDLDDESLARIGQWPWPRTFVAEMIARLAKLSKEVSLEIHSRMAMAVCCPVLAILGALLGAIFRRGQFLVAGRGCCAPPSSVKSTDTSTGMK